ncbi:MAG: AraC family transcriptional regulator [Eubacteriales bacterium]|nr:AraC family transcriptional regulator [Eubacteriales bacterium]
MNQNNLPDISDAPFENMRMLEKQRQIENEILAAVCNGNEERALELNRYYFSSSLCTEENLRAQKDFAIAFDTLLRKSAEQAGVHPVHTDSMSDFHVKQIEQFTCRDDSLSYQDQIIHNYCTLIHLYSTKSYSRKIQRILTFIDTNLRADLSLKTFSEYLSVNSSYLSARFKKEVGLSLTEYVNQKRILYAQSLLATTNLPLKSVAQQCGIPDIYYFSRLFKKITGITPKKYREAAIKSFPAESKNSS